MDTMLPPEPRRVPRLSLILSRLSDHEEEDVRRFKSLEDRLGRVETRVAKGAFLGVLVAEVIRLGAADLPRLLPEILAALGAS